MGMFVKLGEAMNVLGGREEFRFQTTAEALDAMPENATLEGEIFVSGALMNTGQTLRVEGTVRVLRSFVCDRCLGQFSSPQEYSFAEDLARQSDGEAPEDGAVGAVEDTVDVAPLVRDTILTAQPLQNLCRPDCRGLCSRCGADLNQGDCGCDRRRIDPRLADLQKLLTMEDG